MGYVKLSTKDIRSFDERINDVEVATENTLNGYIDDIEQAKLDIGTIGSVKADIQGVISTGQTLKQDLDNDISSGNSVKESLNSSISNANTTKQGLESAIASGDVDSIRSSLAEKANQADLNITNTNVANKRDKSIMITMNDVAQDVKTAMTGGSVAVVGGEGVGFNNLSQDLKEKYGDLITKTVTVNNTGVYNPNTGLIDAGGNYNTQINAVAGDRFALTLSMFTTSYYGVVAVNASGTVIDKALIGGSGSTINYVDAIYVCPANTSKLLISSTVNNIKVKKYEVTALKDFITETKSNYLKNLIRISLLNDFVTFPVNKLDLDKLTASSVIDANGVISSNSGYSVSSPIYVSNPQICITKDTGTGTGFVCTCYDKDGNISGTPSFTDNATHYLITLPQNTAYIRSTVRNAVSSTIMIVDSNVYPSSYDNYKVSVNAYAKYPTRNKKLGSIGDSITYGAGGTSWVTKMAELCGFKTVVNYGVSGSHIATDQSGGASSFQTRYPSMDNDCDYITVWGGVNDYLWNSTITIPLFKTAYENLITGLIAKYPTKKILGITPAKFNYNDGSTTRAWNIPRADGLVLKDFVDAEKEILEKYSVPYLDFFNEMGMSPDVAAQKTACFSDGLHPNTFGNLNIIAPKIASKLISL